MGLMQKLKSLLGIGRSREPAGGQATRRQNADVTVEREPSTASEDAVKGTGTDTEPTTSAETATTGDSETADEPVSADAATESVEEPAEPTTEPGGEADEAAESTSAGDTVVTDEAADDEPTDDGTPVDTLDGIGPAYAERLGQAGIDSVADLAAADAETIGAETDISPKRVQGWIDQANEQ